MTATRTVTPGRFGVAPPTEVEVEQLARAMCALEGRDPDSVECLNPCVLSVDENGRLHRLEHLAWTEYVDIARPWLLARAAALTLVLAEGGKP